MPTLYCDFENGNDNYAGSSFALLAQGTDGRISSTTFSSATANFPNDGSLIGQYLSIFNGSIYAVYNITAWVSSTSLTIAVISGGTGLANQTTDRQFYIGGRWKSLTNGATAVRTIPGDTVRIMGSPAPTSLGQNGVWTSQALQGTKSISSSTNATPIAITCTAHGYSTGDTVVITGISGNTNANGTWEITVTGANTFTLDGSAGNGVGGVTGTVRLRNNTRVMLTTAVTQNIASCGRPRTLWTSANANVTISQLAGFGKESDLLDGIALASGFTTGLAAYWALPSTLDLSGYQQVSFWIQQAAGTIGAAGAVDLRLCSDNAGVTAVNTVSIPALGATGRWMPVTVDLGTNLGNSIQSIAFYVNTDNGAQTFYLSNIIACKASSAADSLTLTSLIGKNVTGETFWGIQSINGRRVMLDADTNASPTSTSVRGYYGTSETVTTWKRETIKLGPAATSSTALQTIQDSGTDGNPITFSGGWDRTNMSTQSLETWLDGVNGMGVINLSSRNYITLDKFTYARLESPYQSFGSFNVFGSHSHLCCNSVIGLYITGAVKYAISINFVTQNTGVGLQINNSTGSVTVNHGVISNGSGGIFMDAAGPIGDALVIKGTGLGLIANNSYGASSLRCPTFSGITTVDNGTGIITTGAYPTNLINCSLLESVETSVTRSDAVFSHNHDQVAGNHKIFMNGALISAAVDERHTVSGISWKIQPANAIRSSSWPVALSLAKVAVAANALVTVKAWMRRDNSGLTMRLVCKGGQIAGVANDVTASVTTTNAWEEETITFTPTETGVVEITAEAWGGTTFSGWVDDLTISQA